MPARADFDQLLDASIEDAFALGEREALHSGGRDLPIYNVQRYHLGFLNACWQPERADTGKRIRPRLCLLTCLASGGELRDALPIATAIELLHNFTLIHDDVQDRSPLRRHRPTVWARWGEAQAINAGDAMFALAHIALNRLVERPIDPRMIIDLSTQLHLTTLRIVEGQVLDLGFESRMDVSPDEYLIMVSGKTAAICRFACWSGACVASSTPERASACAELGHAIGIGFQLRDDVLGIWATTAATGKAAADDIRRRKKSLPIVLLRERADQGDRLAFDAIYQQQELSEDDVEAVLQLLTRYEIQQEAQRLVEYWHKRADRLLATAAEDGPARDDLAALVSSLVHRSA